MSERETVDLASLRGMRATAQTRLVDAVIAGGPDGFLTVARQEDIDVTALEWLLRANDCEQCQVCEGWARNDELVFGEDGINRCDSCKDEVTNKAPEPEEESVEPVPLTTEEGQPDTPPQVGGAGTVT